MNRKFRFDLADFKSLEDFESKHGLKLRLFGIVPGPNYLGECDAIISDDVYLLLKLSFVITDLKSIDG